MLEFTFDVRLLADGIDSVDDVAAAVRSALLVRQGLEVVIESMEFEFARVRVYGQRPKFEILRARGRIW